MRVLFVEDDENFIAGALPLIKDALGTAEVIVCRSKNSAIGHLESELFDFLLLDLKIPVDDGGLDVAVAHGNAVFHAARAKAPGAPILFLTGSSADEVVEDLVKHAEQVDIWGSGTKLSTIQVLRKSNLDKAIDVLKAIGRQISALEQIELRLPGGLLLSKEYRRILKIFTRLRSGAACSVAPLSGGLSDSQVVRVSVSDLMGVEQICAAGKLGTLADVDDEVQRFGKDVNRLAPGAFPQLIEVVRRGAGAKAGAFYRLAEAYDDTLFVRLAGGGNIGSLVTAVSTLTTPWSASLPESSRTVREVRRRLLTDAHATDIARKFDLAWSTEFEQRTLQVRWGCVHGDCHCGNILISRQGSHPILIDFGDVGPGPASLDAITLELSALFHPSFRHVFGDWPDRDRAVHWSNVDKYAGGTPAEPFVRACRTWATRVAAGNREILATAYAYVLRQLKYPGTRVELALTLLVTLRSELEASYAE